MDDHLTTTVLEDGETADSSTNDVFAAIAEHYRTDGSLTDEEVDSVADCAVSVLRDLLRFFDAADVSIDEYDDEDGELVFDVQSSDLAVLIGRHGRTLESLQSLFTLLVSRKLGFRYPVAVDIEGYRTRRKDKLVSMAQSAASRAVRQGSSVALPPMSAYERRIIHLALRDDSRVETHSDGAEPNRHVVVQPC